MTDAIANMVGLFVALFSAGALWFGPPLAHRAWQTMRIRQAASADCRIALTFDDGPGPELTPQLLELLASHGAPATFFVLGSRTEATPGLACELARASHEIGLHSFEHLHAWKTLPWRAVRDLHRTEWAREVFGGVPRLLRPPYGKMTVATWLWTIVRGRRIAWWTFDSGDTWPELPDPDVMAQRLIRAGGGVVLLHDFDREGHADREARQAYVLAVTRAILEQGRDAGFTFCRYSDLVSNTGGSATRA